MGVSLLWSHLRVSRIGSSYRVVQLLNAVLMKPELAQYVIRHTVKLSSSIIPRIEDKIRKLVRCLSNVKTICLTLSYQLYSLTLKHGSHLLYAQLPGYLGLDLDTSLVQCAGSQAISCAAWQN